MGNVIQICNTILPVILMLAIGMICRQKKLLSREGISALKSVVVNITLPAVMVNAFATMEYSGKNIILTLMMFGICLIAWILGKLIKNIFHMESRFIPFLTTGFEAGMLGYALFMLLYGSDRISDFASIDLGQVLFVFTLYKILLGLDGQEKVSAKGLVKDMIQSPTVIAILAGVLLGATGLYDMLAGPGISSMIDACTNFVSAPTSAIILLTIGYDLVLDHIPWAAVGKVTVVRIAIMAALRVLAGVIVRAVGLGDSLDQALNVMMILPPPYVLPVFADDEKQREYVSSSLSVMTLITIIGFILLAVFM
ncbi:MAG: AEC family transporter [Lachnospiraceae bacterium]